jgi:transcriptional regulator
MYIPKHFEEKNKQKLVEFMREYNFAAIVNSTKKRYWATHLPFLITEQSDDIVLKAHMAKANPQWVNFGKEEVLVIFQEPHAYISPKLYEHNVNVPTWNYIAVHAYGVPEILPSREQRISLLEETFKAFEADFKNQRDSLPGNYKEDLLEGIVAFRIKVTKLEGKYKLSQNRSINERKKISDSLTQSPEKTKSKIGKSIKFK